MPSVLFSSGFEMYSLTYFYRIWFNTWICCEWLSERETGLDEHEKQLKSKGNHAQSSVREP